MSTYAIGDIQGCRQELELLLEKINFSESEDHLWLVGDLINRGPDNAGVLDLLMQLPNVTSVLGNHDLHFLAVATGQQTQKRSDTLSDLLDSPRLNDYIEYLRNLPLIHYDESRDIAMVHAGLPPHFDTRKCLVLAREVEDKLRSDDFTSFLSAMYGNEPALWQDELRGMERLRLITNYFTRLRFCREDGDLELLHKTDLAPPGYSPWFSFPRPDGTKILFGHWAALEGEAETDFAIALDTGCVWGRTLTAYRIEDETSFAVDSVVSTPTTTTTTADDRKG